MSPKQFQGGTLSGDTWVTFVNDQWKSSKFTGFAIPDEVFDALVDAGVETIVFVDPNRGRYTSTVDDWQEFGVDEDDSVHLRQSWMVYG